MDTVSRRRRGAPSVAGELEGEAAAHDQNYQTALGQAGRAAETSVGPRGGEVSPGTLESGGAMGLSDPSNLPVANPFHSERVKTEVQLLRHRPGTLDEDAARLRTEVDESALGDASWTGGPGEPDYASLLGLAGAAPVDSQEILDEGSLDVRGTPGNSLAIGGSVPRVARVEPADGALPADEIRDCSWKPAGSVEGQRQSSPEKYATGFEGVKEEPESGRADDPRELIPAREDRLSRVEALLSQVLEENQALRRQIQTESNSSWHSARTPADLPASPMSFGCGPSFPCAPFSTFAGVQTFEHSALRDFQEGPGGFRGEWGLEGGPVPGAQHSLVRAKPLPMHSMGPYGSTERVRVGAPGLSHGESPGFGEEVGGSVGPQSSQVPLPLPPSPVGPPGVPQTMRQFATSALAANVGQGELANVGFHTPRSGAGSARYDSEGYPVSPGGTSIRPPAYPPPASPRVPPSPLGDVYRGAPRVPEGQFIGSGSSGLADKPEEPARYVDSLPKLAQADLSISAVTCGNWLAQVRQIFFGLSSGAVEWYGRVESAAYDAYHMWLVADPLGRLAVDPSSVVAGFDVYRFQRVESRAVTLLLAALPVSVKDDLVMNRWLSSASILFRVLCIWQPGGSSERAHLLSQLVQPETCKNFRDALPTLRRWQQNLQRAREIQASLPDPSLLLKGVDQATSSVLAGSPMIGFRVNSFRHRSGLDYNPSVSGIVQLVRLIQAEFEAASLVAEGAADKRPRNAAAAAAANPKAEPPPPPVGKSGPEPSPSVARVQPGETEGKGKGKGKSKGDPSSAPSCHKFSDASGCRFGDSCMFKHDRSKARKDGRCLACGQSGHFRPECPLVSPENRPVQDSGSEASPSSGGASAAKASAKVKAKAKAGAQVKGVQEDTKPEAAVTPGRTSSGSVDLPSGSEALVAEAAKLLKGVSLRTVHVDLDLSWVRSAITSASDPNYCLVDSGATNALRPASPEELRECQTIRVDLASGETELRINSQGTLLHLGVCQVILPANYLVDLGYSISWRKRGCKIKHPKRGALDVTLAKGCPLIPREVGLRLLREYEERKAGLPVLSKAEVQDLAHTMSPSEARGWSGIG